MTTRKPTPLAGLTVERLVDVLRQNAVAVIGYVDDEDPSDVTIDGHYNLQAIVDALNGVRPKRPARRKR